MDEEFNCGEFRDQIEQEIYELELKLRVRRSREVITANKNFCLDDESIAGLVQINDILYKKMLELVAKVQAVEKKMADEPDFDIIGKLYCEIPIPEDDDFVPEIVSFRCGKGRLFSECDNDSLMEKNFCTPAFSCLGKNLSWPFYCLLEEGILSVPEILRLSERNVYTQIEITL